MKKIIFFSLSILFALQSYAQKEKLWTTIDKIKPFELKCFDAANLLIPKSIKRYFKTENGVEINFKNEAIYEVVDNFIENEFIFYNVSFSGDEYNFNLDFIHSVGQAYTCNGNYFVVGNENILTEYCYGTSSGTITIKRNNKLVYTKEKQF